MSRTGIRASDSASDSSRTQMTGPADVMAKGVGMRLAHTRGSATQGDYATHLGVHVNTYSRWERGERGPDSHAMTLMAIDGWNITWLLTGEGPERWKDLETSAFSASHDLSEEHLSIAMQLADKKIHAERRNPSYDQYARFVALIYEGISKGLPEADIFDIRPGERKPVRRQKDDDSEDGVGSKG